MALGASSIASTPIAATSVEPAASGFSAYWAAFSNIILGSGTVK